MFCMLLRKYIGGGRVQGFRQIDGDRILEMDVSSLSELGDPVIRTLVIEIMGRHSNIILLTGGRTIIDAARHINETLSRVRQIEPGLPYERPPLQGKISMDALNAGILADRLRSADTSIARAISKTISGFSPQAAEEAAAVLGLNPDLSPDFYDVDAIARDLCAYVASLQERGPCVVLFGESGSPKDIYPFPQAHLPDAEMRRCTSPSEALDLFFRERNLHERLNQHISGIAHVLKNNIERCEKKIAIQEDALRNAARMDEYKKRGELIQGNLYMIEKGAKSATVPDYYSENCEPIEIPLDEALSPAQNAQRYFKLYQKARGAQRLAAEQKQKAEDELHKTFATLSQEEQKFANIFLHDIQSGDVVVTPGKTFKEYVIEYVSRAKDDQIHRLAAYALGLNEMMLRNLMAQHVTEDNINEFGRFDALKATVDKARAKAYFDAITGLKLPIPKVNIRVDNLLRDFILKGGYDIEMPE